MKTTHKSIKNHSSWELTFNWKKAVTKSVIFRYKECSFNQLQCTQINLKHLKTLTYRF